MPDGNLHQTAASNHFAAANSVLDKHPDWAAVMVFYSALHYVEEACATWNLHHTEHVQRDEHIRRGDKELYRYYKRLKDESLKVRYMQGGVFSLTSAQVKRQIIESVFPSFLARVACLRKQPLVPPGTPMASTIG